MSLSPTCESVNSAAAPVLLARGLSKHVASGSRELTILRDLELEVQPGESLAILGQSGAGKSTLLALLAGLDTPSAGELDMFGTSLTALDEDGRAALRNGRVGFVFQNFQLLPTLTALENVLLPTELTPLDRPEQRARQWLERVGLGERLAHLPKQLSGGEQQRVALARAFVTGPELVFADEPTGNLDPETGERIIQTLFELNRSERTTLVLVTHDHALARRCDRCLQLASGKLVDMPLSQLGPAAEVSS
ncbi:MULTISPECIES: ABC transporter ATP-binding protein [Halomonas]|uniref:ABC transporter ATP-binding protein n=1 Tax=Halomonas TaxID=2745 RepID=UPI001C93CD27|nr:MULTISPECIES: ATP-binding cassette domain-containing protein [Halomonas]MED5294810.1 ATP-binding cassette domain-containing protein [Pseudomonadota bacterium]MBY5924485.1 ATP-binding cassette domain-containing protein [Halomonas sp. DP4Y7-2]MBY5929804.1 ATP-binding cassette domain-containing protein [Halomonas sp. DP8Y7-3]MBY5968446.1 ATP-binding cassette domain-containing protein [Halomonas denitrificans]MBY5984177.1 ATP-binding cassette domain-containing protein [Halomonas sp. DP5Y7-2]